MKIIADENIPFVKECFSSIGEVITCHGRKISNAVLKDADALLIRSITKVDQNLLAGTNVKFVATATIGFEHIDIDYLEKNNIGFSSAPGSNANSVSEYITSAILNLADKYNFDITKKSIGIIGAGNVGGRVEKKAKALGMKVVLNDPPLARKTGDEKYRPLKEIFDCDIITCHTPLNTEGIDKTYHLADETFFKSMKKGTIFINSSRGKVHDTAALKNAIRSGKLTAAVLDVWENEPSIDVELLDMVDFATPHIAGYSYDGKVAGMIMIYEAFCRHFGIEITRKIEDFLPAPQISEIFIKNSEKKPLLFAVSALYDIKKDDAAMRRLKDQPADKQGQFFDALRKNYPVRREFQNTKISVSDEKLKSVFGLLGFKTI
jgi:erythronate-4-phosphate dehydrogenase